MGVHAWPYRRPLNRVVAEPWRTNETTGTPCLLLFFHGTTPPTSLSLASYTWIWMESVKTADFRKTQRSA